MKGTLSAILVAAGALLLPIAVLGQQETIDPATGLAPEPVLSQEFVPPADDPLAGGEVIGYTTNALIPHFQDQHRGAVSPVTLAQGKVNTRDEGSIHPAAGLNRKSAVGAVAQGTPWKSRPQSCVAARDVTRLTAPRC